MARQTGPFDLAFNVHGDRWSIRASSLPIFIELNIVVERIKLEQKKALTIKPKPC